jgi:hypothetical protein
MPVDVVEAFREYLGEWRKLAGKGAAVHWEADVPADTAEYLVLPFFRLAERLEETAALRGPAAPAEAGQFYRLLVAGLLDGLAADGQSSAEFAEHLRSFWPGTD